MSKTTDNTKPKQSNLKPFKPGQSGNPAGRPKGARSKFSETFMKDMLAEWEKHGAVVLSDVREKDPAAFLRVAATLLPKELNLNEGETALERLLEQYSDTELDQLITGLCTLGLSGEGTDGEDEAGTGNGPSTIQ